MTDDRSSTSPRDLAEYLRFRAESRIVEGDGPPSGPAGNRERVRILDRAALKMSRDEREYAVRELSERGHVSFYCDRSNRVINVNSIEEWDAGHQAPAVAALKVDA